MNFKLKLSSICVAISVLLPTVSAFSTQAVESNLVASSSEACGTGDLSLLYSDNTDNITTIETVEDYYKLTNTNPISTQRARTASLNTLPESVDNSESEYFPEIDSQGTMGSCVSWAQVYYQFTYTMNKSMGVATTRENTFSPKWIHNFANNGKKDGSWNFDVYSLMTEIGNVPITMVPYDDDYLSWSPQEEIWKTALKYRIKGYQTFKAVGDSNSQITSNDDSDLDVIKTSLANGDILTFSTYLGAFVKTKIKANPDAPENYKYEGETIAVRRSGSSEGHRMTLVGYNDNIWTDINENGKIDDGEMGAFKIANSWGTSFGNDGFIWVAYDAVNRVSSVSNAPQDSKREFLWMDINRMEVVPYDSDSSIYLKYTLNTSDRSQGKIYATATKDGTEYTYEIGPKRRLGLSNSTYSYDGTTQSNDGTMVYALSNVVPELTSENLHEYSWSFTFEDTTADNATFTVKDVEIVDEITGRICKPENTFPFTLNGNSKTVDFPAIEESGTVIYYRGFENPVLHYKTDNSSWNTVAMESNTLLRGYTHKTTLQDITKDSVVTLWFSDDNGNIDDNNGQYYKTNDFVNYFVTENARSPLEIAFYDNISDKAEAEKSCTFAVTAVGGYEPYQYKYTFTNLETNETTQTDYIDSAEYTTSFSEGGNYTLTVSVKEFSDAVSTVTKAFTVEDHCFEFTDFSVSPSSKIRVGKKLEFTAITDFEHIKSTNGSYNEYNITIQNDTEICYSVTVISSAKDLNNMTSTVKLSWVPQFSGNYVATITSTDDNGEYATKALSFFVSNNLLGDINQDTYITVSDATLLQLYLADINDVSDIWEAAADVDKNGYISINDVTNIQKYLVDMDDCGEVGEILNVDFEQPEPPLTVPTTVPKQNYIYYKNTNNWSTVNAYYWSKSNTTMTAWPGVPMTSIGNNVYRIEIPENAEYIIFNNGSSQTDDITLQGMNKIYSNSTWSDYTEGATTEPTEPTTVADGNYLYYYNASGWSSVNAYYWSKSNTTMTVWPGVPMTSIGNNVYRIEIPENAEYIIFNNGSSQTEDILIKDKNMIYKNGSWSLYS